MLCKGSCSQSLPARARGRRQPQSRPVLTRGSKNSSGSTCMTKLGKSTQRWGRSARSPTSPPTLYSSRTCATTAPKESVRRASLAVSPQRTSTVSSSFSSSSTPLKKDGDRCRSSRRKNCRHSSRTQTPSFSRSKRPEGIFRNRQSMATA